jgi:preprotein translocase subunit YajC
MVKFVSKLFFGLNLILVLQSLALADGPVAPAVPGGGASAAAPQSPGLGGMLFPMVAIFLVFYFLMMRPQQKKAKEHQSMLTALQHGDEVVTTSGILGKVTGITDKVVTLEIADNVRIKLLKGQISQVLKGQNIKDLG